MLAAPEPVGSWLVAEGVVDDVLPADGVKALDPGTLTRAAIEHPGVLRGARVDLAVNLHGDGGASTGALAALRPRRLIAYASAAHPHGPVWDAAEHEALRWARLVREGLPARTGRAVPQDGPHPRGPQSADADADAVADDLVLRPRPSPQRDPRLVVLHPGAAAPSRRWPVERWIALAFALSTGLPAALPGQGGSRRLVVTGSRAEAAVCRQVVREAAAAGVAVEDTAGQLDVAGLVDLIWRAGLVVSGDTGIAHVATATRTPSVLLFGPSPPSRWGPLADPERHDVLWPASPGYRGDPHADTTDPVLATISVDDVLRACHRLAEASSTWHGR